MTARSIALALALANVGIWGSIPAQASAANVDARIVSIADETIERVAPNAINYCRGDSRYTEAPGISADGFADGWVADGVGGWQWDHTLCGAAIRMLPGQTWQRKCEVYYHERLHFVLGPEHVGPLSESAPYPAACEPIEPAACPEDSPCWVWSEMGNYHRSVYLRGRMRPTNVGPCRFSRLVHRHLINWKRTPRLRGDHRAKTYGC